MCEKHREKKSPNLLSTSIAVNQFISHRRSSLEMKDGDVIFSRHVQRWEAVWGAFPKFSYLLFTTMKGCQVGLIIPIDYSSVDPFLICIHKHAQPF